MTTDTPSTRPEIGDRVSDDAWEPSGVVTGYDRDGLVEVLWSGNGWKEGYNTNRMSYQPGRLVEDVRLWLLVSE